MSDTQGQCEVCKEPCAQKCSHCKIVYYCSTEHQKENWKDHKKECTTFEVCSNKELGRYLVARRDLEPGDIIFIDTPLVFGPRPYKIQDGPLPCVGCSKIILEEMHACAECGWPACSPECIGLTTPQMHGFECNILKLRPPKSNEPNNEYFRFDTLILLRALFLQKTNKKRWDTLLNLEDHLDDRGPSSDVFKIVQEKIIYIQENFITPLKMYEKETGQAILPHVSSDIMHKIYAIFDVNAVELTEPDLFILYPLVSLLEHNCVPNTYQTIDEKDGYKTTFRAASTIKKGEHITNTYTNILWGTQERRRHLKELKYFHCMCRRCTDPTELGTFFSALVCLGSDQEPCKGIQLPLNLTEENPDWICNKCGIKLPNKEISGFVSHLSREVDKEMEKKPKLEELEEFLSKLEIFLHPNHFLVYTIKHSLVQLYKTEGDIEISNNFLTEKLKMCDELINLTKKIDPNNTRLALYLAVLLNEQFMGKYKLLIRNFSSNDKEASHELIKETSKILKEAIKALEYEQQSDAGSKLLQVVTINEMRFDNWLKEQTIQLH